MKLLELFFKNADLISKFVKTAQSQQNFHVLEWIQYWFGGSFNTNMASSSVIFLGLDYITKYLNAYVQSLRVDKVPRLSELRADLEFLSKIEDVEASRKQLQEIFDKYAPSYFIQENPDKTIKLIRVDRYGVPEVGTTRNINVIKQYQEELRKRLEQLIQDLIREAKEKIRELKLELGVSPSSEWVKRVPQKKQRGLGKKYVGDEDEEETVILDAEDLKESEPDIFEEIGEVEPRKEENLASHESLLTKMQTIGQMLGISASKRNEIISTEFLSSINNSLQSFANWFDQVLNRIKYQQTENTQETESETEEQLQQMPFIESTNLWAQLRESFSFLERLSNMFTGLSFTQTEMGDIFKNGLTNSKFYRDLTRLISQLHNSIRYLYDYSVQQPTEGSIESQVEQPAVDLEKIEREETSRQKLIMKKIRDLQESILIASNKNLPIEKRFFAIGWVGGYLNTYPHSFSGYEMQLEKELTPTLDTMSAIYKEVQTEDGSVLDANVVLSASDVKELKDRLFKALSNYYNYWNSIVEEYKNAVASIRPILESHLRSFNDYGDQLIRAYYEDYDRIFSNAEETFKSLRIFDTSHIDNLISKLERRTKSFSNVREIITKHFKPISKVNEMSLSQHEALKGLDEEARDLVSKYVRTSRNFLEFLRTLREDIEATAKRLGEDKQFGKNWGIVSNQFKGLTYGNVINIIKNFEESLNSGNPDLEPFKVIIDFFDAVSKSPGVASGTLDYIRNLKTLYGRLKDMLERMSESYSSEKGMDVRVLEMMKEVLSNIESIDNPMNKFYTFYNFWTNVKRNLSQTILNYQEFKEYRENAETLIVHFLRSFNEILSRDQFSTLGMVKQLHKSVNAKIEALKRFEKEYANKIQSKIDELTKQEVPEFAITKLQNLSEIIAGMLLPNKKAIASEQLGLDAVIDMMEGESDLIGRVILDNNISSDSLVGYGTLLGKLRKMLIDCEKSLLRCKKNYNEERQFSAGVDDSFKFFPVIVGDSRQDTLVTNSEERDVALMALEAMSKYRRALFAHMADLQSKMSNLEISRKVAPGGQQKEIAKQISTLNREMNYCRNLRMIISYEHMLGEDTLSRLLTDKDLQFLSRVEENYKRKRQAQDPERDIQIRKLKQEYKNIRELAQFGHIMK